VIVDNLPIQMYQENKQSPLTPNVLLISLYAELYNVCIHSIFSIVRMIYYNNFNMINTTSFTSGEGTGYPSGAHEFTTPPPPPPPPHTSYLKVHEIRLWIHTLYNSAYNEINKTFACNKSYEQWKRYVNVTTTNQNGHVRGHPWNRYFLPTDWVEN
jgi:hypothetical protein